jgi:HEAT repeat protein
LAIRAAARLLPDDTKAPLVKLLPSGDERVRLAAARALANLGERKDVLETLIALLDSPTVRIRSRSQQSLRALTAQAINFAPEGKVEDRAAAAAEQWLEASARRCGSLCRIGAIGAARADAARLAGPGLVEPTPTNGRWRQRAAPAWGCQGCRTARLIAV